jgi:dTDP-glucose 4,6-dehydratase
MRVLLTGATGFIGAQVLNCLIEEGCAMTALVEPETQSQLAHRSQLKAVLGRLSDRKALAQATKGVELVLHVAGKILGRPAADLMEVNIRGTENLLGACVASGVRRFVFVSSAAVYRPALSRAQLPITEASPLGPAGSAAFRNYGKSKTEAERLVLECHQSHGLEYSIVRPTTAYGPSHTPESMEEFLRKILRNANLVLAGQQRWLNMQWVYVVDAANAIVRAGISPAGRNQVFTIAGAELFDLPTLAKTMLDILWPAVRIRLPNLSLTPMHSSHLVFDIGKAQRMIGYRPKIDLRTGLSRLLEDMGRNGKLPLPFSRGRNAEFCA